MEYRDCVAASGTTYIQEKNPSCSIISVSVNENRLERVLVVDKAALQKIEEVFA